MNKAHRHPAPRGFTLVEIMVVMVVSILLMTTVTTIYVSSLRVYRESQGVVDVFATAQIINRDLRQIFGNVVAIPGGLITPVTNNFDTSSPAGKIDSYYLDSAINANEYAGPKGQPVSKGQLMSATWDYDRFFSKSQYPPPAGSVYDTFGYSRPNPTFGSPDTWASAAEIYPGLKGWWMPAFFGKADGNTDEVLKADDIRSGSWGWPRPDFRMDIDLDDSRSPKRCACWFYAENRNFNSPLTLALDNSNIVLVSLKFTSKKFQGRDVTQISVLRHQINGFDSRDASVKADLALSDSIRAFKVIPRFLKPDGRFTEDTDDLNSYLGVSTSGGAIDSELAKKSVPRCFDIKYTLANPANKNRYNFALRVYNQASPH